MASLMLFVLGKHTLFIVSFIQMPNCSFTVIHNNNGSVCILSWLSWKLNKWFLESQLEETMSPLTSCNAFHILRYYIIIVQKSQTYVGQCRNNSVYISYVGEFITWNHRYRKEKHKKKNALNANTAVGLETRTQKSK